MSYFSKLKIIYKDIRKIIFFNVFLLNLVNTFLEVFNIALLVPLFSVITGNSDILSKIKIIPESFFYFTDYEKIIIIILFIVSVYVIKVFFFVFGHYYQSKHIYIIGSIIGNKLVRKYLNSSIAYHIYNSSSVIIRNVYTEVNEFIETNIRSSFVLINDFLVLTGILIFLLIIDPFKLLILIIFSLLILTIFFFFRNIFIRIGSKRMYYEETRLRHLQNLLKSIREIKIYQREEYFFKLFSFHNYENYRYGGKKLFLSNLPRVIIESFVLIFVMLMLIFVLNSKNSLNNFDIETSILFLAAIIRFIPLISRINSSLNSLRFGVANLNVLSDEISRNIETTTNNKKYEFLRNIVFKNVTFKYENQKNSIINKINFEIKKGDLIKITGKSGSGKSTLTNLIIGFFEPNEGEILVDGTQMKGYSEDWIKKIGLVSQSVFLFNDTVENNITFGSPTDKIKLKDILNNLNLGESRFSPLSIIEENGKNLSGGEIQRIAIARALYNDSDIIIFDEPTSNLDFENAELIEKLINSLTKKKTVIVISHDQKRFNDARLTLNMN